MNRDEDLILNLLGQFAESEKSIKIWYLSGSGGCGVEMIDADMLFVCV